MKHIHTFEEFLNEASTSGYVDQDDISAARKIVTGLKPGKYTLKQDVNAWVIDMKDQEESNNWIGKSNIPRVKLSQEKLKKGTKLEVNSFGEEVYLNGNKDNPIWLINPTLFSRSRIKDQFYEELRKIADLV
jgi:hypothetical protein